MGLGELINEVGDRVTNIMPLDTLFGMVVDTNIASSSVIAVPTTYTSITREYAASNFTDGLILNRALLRFPVYHRDGWILRVQTGAEAMTLDRHVFTHAPLKIDTYVHELVHVTQYALVGRTGFLVSYFGLSAAEIAWRFVKRKPLNVMDSSPHENQAYELERRFRTWLRKAHPEQMVNCSGR
jgi:hypothetical protein